MGSSQVTTVLLTKIAAAWNEVALSYHRVRELYFLPVIFAATIYSVIRMTQDSFNYLYSHRKKQLPENLARALYDN